MLRFFWACQLHAAAHLSRCIYNDLWPRSIGSVTHSGWVLPFALVDNTSQISLFSVEEKTGAVSKECGGKKIKS